MGITAAEAAMQRTPDEHIEAVKALCERVAHDPQIKSCYVDDWGRFSNFQVILYPAVLDRGTTARLKALLRKQLPQGSQLREMHGPDRVREWDRYERRYRNMGYSRKFWMVDIDYQAYNPETNSFAAA